MVTLNKSELNLILKQGENQYVEFKENFSDSVIETLVAFSNFKGGKVILGINKNKKIVGLNLKDESLQNWQNEIKTKTEPFITPDIYSKKINGKIIVFLEIIEFPLKPVSFKNKYFLRKNNSNHKMSTTEVTDMFLRIRNSSWDFYPRDNFKVKDLDNKKIKKVISLIENNLQIKIKSVKEFLKKYNLVLDDGKVTNAAVLLFSKTGLRETDIQIGLFQDEITIKKNKIIRNDLISQVEEVMDFIKAYILKEFVIGKSPYREEKWQYPIEAIRELVINAIIHRDYRGVHSQFKIFQNEIHLFNSGSLPHDLTVKDIMSGIKKSEPRNKLIAEIFRDCGLIERYGSGVKRVREMLRLYGLKDLKIHADNSGFYLKVFGKKLDKTKLSSNIKTVDNTVDKTVDKLLDEIKKNPKITQKDLENIIGLTRRGIEWNLEKLKREGKIKRIGPKKGGHWEIIK